MTDLPGHHSLAREPGDHERSDAIVTGASSSRPSQARLTSIIRPTDPGGVSLSTGLDGRSARRGRNREAVIKAMLELVDEGDLAPATAEIADRAGVSHRSVFRYFDDLGDLVREAISIAFGSAFELGIIHDIGQGTLEHRIDTIVQSRIRVYSQTYNVSRVARFRCGEIEEIDKALAEVAQLLRLQLKRQFATELVERPADEQDAVLDALLVMTDFVPFDILRRMSGYDDERIAKTWRFGFTALLS
jgi:TetR/AcrR family transcriptional regulator of autoinduction and epiphytic fitness